MPSDFVAALSEFGLAMLFFVAGSEIEFTAFRGRTGRFAVFGWLISLAVGVGVTWILVPGEIAIVIGIALCSTALGTLLPILRDAGELRTPFGRAVGAIGAVGEFGPLIAISIFLGASNPGIETLVLLLFGLVAGLAIWLAFKMPRGAMHRFVNSTLHTSGQFAIRVVFLILSALVALSIVLDLDLLLGAFAAGIVWRLLMRDADEPCAQGGGEQGRSRRVRLPRAGLLHLHRCHLRPRRAARRTRCCCAVVPVVLVLLFVVRGLPSTLAAPHGSSRRDRLSVAFLGRDRTADHRRGHRDRGRARRCCPPRPPRSSSAPECSRCCCSRSSR